MRRRAIHGTRACYQSGCRRPECKKANRDYMRDRRGTPYWGDRRTDAYAVQPQTDVEVLAVTCWCEGSVVGVPRDDVLAGRTGSCGAPRCKEEVAV